jgi:hypothetical protein
VRWATSSAAQGGGAQQQGEDPGEGEQAKPNEQALTGDAGLRVIVALEQGQARAAQTVR